MNNRERKEFLIRQAEDALELREKYWKEKNWNTVIRRAQEGVECYIKGFLKLIGIEFPREYDRGGWLEEILLRKRIPFEKRKMTQVKEISEELAEKRAPAFYGEVFYSQKEARRARKGAEEVKKFYFETYPGI